MPRTEERLLENDPAVLGLFAGNPFPNAPPRIVRAVLWQYWFSTQEEKRPQGFGGGANFLVPTPRPLLGSRMIVSESLTLPLSKLHYSLNKLRENALSSLWAAMLLFYQPQFMQCALRPDLKQV